MDLISKRTYLALFLAAIFHAAVLFFIYENEENFLEVPLMAEQISTRMGFRKPQPKVEAPTPPKPIVKTTPKKIKPKPIKKRILTAKQNPDLALPDKLVIKPTRVASLPQHSGGARQKQSQDDIRKYINRVIRMIDRKKYYPRLSRENGEEGTVMVSLVLNSSGQVVSFDLNNQSVYHRLGAATERTVKKAGPFPPLPSSYDKSQLSFQVPVRFKLARR